MVKKGEKRRQGRRHLELAFQIEFSVVVVRKVEVGIDIRMRISY
jgi:hypothetical protein